jgi:hypothetical protein
MAIANEAPPTDVRGLEDHFKDKPDAGIERFWDLARPKRGPRGWWGEVNAGRRAHECGS